MIMLLHITLCCRIYCMNYIVKLLSRSCANKRDFEFLTFPLHEMWVASLTTMLVKYTPRSGAHLYNIHNYLIYNCLKWSTQWTLKPQINIEIWSITWHNIHRPIVDILVMSNYKYHMDINTWGQFDVKNVSRNWLLAQILGEKEYWLKKMLVEE